MNNLDIRAKNLLATGYEVLCYTCKYYRNRLFLQGAPILPSCAKFNRKVNPKRIKCKKHENTSEG